MARIYAADNCIFCGKGFSAKEEAVLITVVKTKPETMTSGGKYARQLQPLWLHFIMNVSDMKQMVVSLLKIYQ